MKKQKPIHLIKQYGSGSRAVCDCGYRIIPIEATIKAECYIHLPKGTFDPTKVTCKRCLKSEDYKTAMDRIRYPLFFLKENR